MATILIVEDTEMQAGLLRRFIQESHTLVGIVSEADKAVQVAQETLPDAVVMDLNLDEGNGIQATSSIKSIDPSIKVIVSSVYVSIDLRMEAFEAGANRYLTKPYDRQQLFAAINSVLEDRYQ